MAFTAISSTLRQVGKAVTKTLVDLISDNLDDLDTRITGLEGAAGKIIVFDEVVVNHATLNDGGTLTGLAYWRSPAAFSLTDAKIGIFTKGSLTGNLEIDIKVASSPDFTSSVSVFTTKPKIVYSTASDYDESANTVFDNTNKVIAAGDFIRLDITEIPASAALSAFTVYVIGES